MSHRICMREMLVTGLLAIGVGLAIARCAVACSPAATLEDKQALADSKYAAEQMKCVDDAITIEQSRACRTASRLKWDAGMAIVDVSRDAGDAGK